MKPTLANLFNTVATLIYLNLYCFLYAFVCIMRGEGSVFRISKEVTHIFHPRFFVAKGSKPVRMGKTMYFMNHRSYADYFVDCFITGGSSYLSKLSTIFSFPGPSYCGYLLNFVWFFYKHKGIDRKWFTKFVASKWNHRHNSGCIAYPEGHISKPSAHPTLRTGVMEVAYNLNCPCQVVLTSGKEEIIDAETLQFKENVHVRVCVSEVLIPRDYKTKEEWFQKVNEVWEATSKLLAEREGEMEIIAPLPGVNTDLCVDEPISGNAMVYSVAALFALAAICYSLYTM